MLSFGGGIAQSLITAKDRPSSSGQGERPRLVLTRTALVVGCKSEEPDAPRRHLEGSREAAARRYRGFWKGGPGRPQGSTRVIELKVSGQPEMRSFDHASARGRQRRAPEANFGVRLPKAKRTDQGGVVWGNPSDAFLIPGTGHVLLRERQAS
jgi:hypothetical protein